MAYEDHMAKAYLDVVRVWPNSVAKQWSEDGQLVWMIHRNTTEFITDSRPLGKGESEQAAWEDAALKL